MGRIKGTRKVVDEDVNKIKWERQEARAKRISKEKAGHRLMIFGNAPDTLVIPEGVVFECIEEPLKH